MLTALILVLISVGCTGRVSTPEQSSIPSASPSAVIEATTTIPATATDAEQMVMVTSTAGSTSTTVPATDDVKYQDDFTKPTSGWPSAKYDNYFIGYHEPDYYHVALQSPNSRTSVFIPEKPSFGDATIEVKVFTDPNNTATEGDFRYGTIFRRSGDLFYAFVISPRTQKWYVLKSTLDKLEVLKEGTDDSIQGLEAKDTLRVDAKGPTFFFHINDHLVDQVSDPDYATGEVGFFVQTFDSTRAHIHFDSITIRNVQVQWICSFLKKALYLRSGPGSSFTPITSLTQGDSMEPLGISPDGEWIRVRVERSDQLGWVAVDQVSCNAPVTGLPVVTR
jgi:hypothetical protein